MSYSNHIERYGNLRKHESLVTMENKILPNTFVLEAPEPFPGCYSYYSDVPTDNKPLYLYFVLQRLYTIEETTRATQNIKKYFKSNFSCAAGTIEIYNQTFDVLRIRHLESYDLIKDLQTCYMDEGVEFKTKGRKIEGQGLIRIKKFFMLEDLGDNMYCDLDEKDHGYFIIPKLLKWKEFEELTTRVKNNWNTSTFDAALGHFHRQFELEDMVRIYTPSMSKKLLLELRELYLTQMK